MNINLGPFEVEHSENQSRLHIEIDNIHICINRTYEGLIVDVFNDQDDAPVEIGTMALDNDVLFPETNND